MDTTPGSELALVDLFGMSELDPFVQRVLEDLEATRTEGSLGRAVDYRSRTLGLHLSFWYKGYYRDQVGPLKSEFLAPDAEEVVLEGLTYRPESHGQLKLPYELELGDGHRTIAAKLDVSAFARSKGPDYAHSWTFVTADHEILAALDGEKRLLWLRMWALRDFTRKKVEFKRNVRLQNKNINPQSGDRVLALTDATPVELWEARMADGDENFTAVALDDARLALHEFLAHLAKAACAKRGSAVMTAVKKTVEKFNRLNESHDTFVETTEREELAEFISTAVSLTGFEIEAGVDITEEWRLW